jgi:glutathione S-transferase
MKLFYNTASPYARKARIVVRETGLLAKVEEVLAIPVENLPELVAANPLAQIPALVDDEGVRWVDSSLISARLDALNGHRLMPQGEAAWPVRRLEVAASGLLEMLVKMVLEFRRPEQYQSPFWLKRWEDNLMRGFAVAEQDCPEADTVDLATITLAIAGTYTTFRYPHLDWQSAAPKIAELTAELEKRQSFIDTYPK